MPIERRSSSSLHCINRTHSSIVWSLKSLQQEHQARTSSKNIQQEHRFSVSSWLWNSTFKFPDCFENCSEQLEVRGSLSSSFWRTSENLQVANSFRFVLNVSKKFWTGCEVWSSKLNANGSRSCEPKVKKPKLLAQSDFGKVWTQTLGSLSVRLPFRGALERKEIGMV